ncbi:restriction endonuclease [Streptomyces justiciae]|uniref:restriction endonuclease n=1 Tax=Streptomyces justiciae TaxID=2780140 RepID=UPI0021191A5F|nr:restriction endonuclease [Streptomyces justiciae]MCW8383914.1 restriction endonuclease [Streptomyces justiciae]
MTRRSRRNRRKQQLDEELLVALGGFLIAVCVVMAVVNWLINHWWVLVLAVVLAVLAGAGWWQHRTQQAAWKRAKASALRYGLAQLDGLTHRQFEHAVRDLMHRDGCTNAVQVGGRGDLGADVKAVDPFGRRWVIQCKHRKNGERGAAVGTPDLQVLNGTGRPVHNADVVVLVTNGRITQPGRDFAGQQRLHLVDRALLGEWAAGSRPLWELLKAMPPPRKPSALS